MLCIALLCVTQACFLAHLPHRETEPVLIPRQMPVLRLLHPLGLGTQDVVLHRQGLGQVDRDGQGMRHFAEHRIHRQIAAN